jgi:predicted neuraminidase
MIRLSPGNWPQYSGRCLILAVVLLGFAYAFWQQSPVRPFNLSAFTGPNEPRFFLVPSRSEQRSEQPKAVQQQSIHQQSVLQQQGWARDHLPKPDVAEVHAASLVATDRHLIAFWYGGSREGSRDAQIFAADWPLPTSHAAAENPDQQTALWQNLRVVMTPQQIAKDQQRYIKKIGNAVPYVDAQGVVWLMFVTVSVGGWAGSALNLTYSTDQGLTWSPVKRLVTSPFYNVSTLGRSKPLVYTNGETLWPVYHEFIAKFAQGLHLDVQGNVLGILRISSGRQGFQPSFVAASSQEGLALLRSVGHQQGRVMISRTHNAGQSWTVPQALSQINPDAAVDALRLSSGDIIWVYNDAPHSRHVLSLGLSTDQGKSWQKLCDLAHDPAVENGHGFSYPSLLQDRTGIIHLLYSEGRHAIRHDSFTPEWLQYVSQLASPGTLCSDHAQRFARTAGAEG